MICSKSETMQCCCNGVLVLRLVQISVAISDDETNSWLLATCSEVLLEKLTVAQLAKKFHTYMERGISQSHEQERNTLSCTELYCVLHRAVWSHFTTTSSFTDRPSRTQFHAVFFFTSGFSPETLQHFSYLPLVLHTPTISPFLQVTNFLITQISPATFCKF